jgi:hypothetical protein
MALKFGETKGKAQKATINDYKYKDGENVVRLVGGVLPRYVYWVKGTNGKDIPIECLAFDREKEKFTNVEKDWVQEYWPDKRCSWAYSINCIDPSDGQVKVLNLKKKLFEQILTAAEDLGDPTDPANGWDVVFKRVKTGPLAYNVEYTLQVLRCKKRALSEDELKAVEVAQPIDNIYTRPSVDEVKALCDRILNGESDSNETAPAEDVNELDNA